MPVWHSTCAAPTILLALEKLVGRDLLRQAAKLHVDDAVRRATEIVDVFGRDVAFLNPRKLESNLGFLSAEKGQKEGLAFLLKRADVNIEDLRELIDVAKNIEGVGDPAQFVKRRAIIGGVSGATALAGVGGAVLVGADPTLSTFVTFGALTLLSRDLSRIISSPKALKAMTTAARYGVGDNQPSGCFGGVS